jgi:hypothetical protein
MDAVKGDLTPEQVDALVATSGRSRSSRARHASLHRGAKAVKTPSSRSVDRCCSDAGQRLGLGQADKKIRTDWKSEVRLLSRGQRQGRHRQGQELKVVDMTTAAFQAKKDDELKKAILEGWRRRRATASSPS